MIINKYTGRRIAEFTICGIEQNERTAGVVLPDQFREKFDGHSFKDWKVFGEAVKFANCAYAYADSPMHGHTVNAYKSSLQYVLDNDSI